MNIKQFLKPNWIKLILFIILFLIIFFSLPFVKISSNLGTESLSLFLLIKNYSGSEVELSMVLSGFIIYFITAYFISCLVTALRSDIKGKK
ncbi:MAG: hypothetical protein NTU58_03330 [Candidatus Nealsonbacteria bacterium]|nr:hypothetical protein [Candidatus Nealsonbacteria bacterium]